jgi:AcrR family transcriptional regulator
MSIKKEPSLKRDRILKAAIDCFTQYGFKRTSMDDIAQKAGISRAALYLVFQNKEDIFITLSEQLHEDAIERASLALELKGPLVQRLMAAFEGKDRELFELVKTSPHGVELVEIDHQISGDICDRAEQKFIQLLASAIAQAQNQGEISLEGIGINPNECAELLRLSVYGLKKGSQSFDEYRHRLGKLISLFSAAVASEQEF